MSEEIKPVKSERIDNIDGSYIVKEIFDKNVNGVLSQILYYNQQELLVKKQYFSDKIFKNILCTSKYKYNDDKSWTEYDVYAQDQGGWKSITGTFDSKKRQTSSKTYSDKKFKNLIKEATRKYNKNGSYEENTIDYNSKLKAISYFNKKGQEKKRDVYDINSQKLLYKATVIKYLKNGNIIFYYLPDNVETLYNNDKEWKILVEKQYKKSGFKGLDYTYFYTYLDNGYYERKTVFENTNCCESKCVIEKFDKNDRLVERKDYKDKKCKKLYYTEKQQKNGYTICSEVFEVAQGEIKYYSTKWKNDKENNSIWQKFYADKNFSELLSTHSFEYHKNDVMIRKIVYKKLHLDRFLSKIERYKKGKIISKKLYKDNCFNELLRKCKYIYLQNGNSVDICTEKNPPSKHAVFWVRVEDNAGNMIEEIGKFKTKTDPRSKSVIQITKGNTQYRIFYKDSNFKKVLLKAKTIYSKDKNSYVRKSIFYEVNDGKLSSIAQKTKNGGHEIAYYDNAFKNVYREGWVKFDKNNIKLILEVYKKPQNGYKAVLSYYDKDKNLIEEKKYKYKAEAVRIYKSFGK